MTVFPRHPLSLAFGSMSDEEYTGLRDSIATDGVLDPICLYEGMVLDGYHRQRAAVETGRECPSFELAAHADPRSYVIAKNKHRRNQTPSQAALAVAEVMAWKKPWRPSEQEKGAPGAALSTPELAALAGVSERSMRHAKAVARHAAPEVRDAVREGLVGVKKAAQIATLPKDEQVVALIDNASAPAVALKHKANGEKPTPDFDDVAALHMRIAELEAELTIAQELNTTLQEKNAEQAQLLNEVNADLEAANRVLDATDKVKASMEEAKRFRDAHRQLEDRLRGAMIERNEAIKTAQVMKRRLESNGRAVRH